MKKRILIVDAYNMIGRWHELAQLKKRDLLADARDRLLHILSDYQKLSGQKIIVVFDAMYVPGMSKTYPQANLQIVWTSEDQTADSYIEALALRLNNSLNLVTVATSDQAEQWTVFAQGAIRMPAGELEKHIKATQKEVRHTAKHYYTAKASRKQSLNADQQAKLARLRDQLARQNDD